MECLIIWSNSIQGVSVGVFWMRLTFKTVDRVEQITFPNLVELQFISEGLNKTVKADPSLSRSSS